MEEMKSKLSKLYQDRYVLSPELFVKAPGRVNLIGDHTDYNAGFAMPMAINKYTYLAIGKRRDLTVLGISASYLDEELEFDLRETIVPNRKASHWTNYAKGVINSLKQLSNLASGFNFAVNSDLPHGAGLSSSASFEVALGTAINGLFSLNLSPKKIALVGQKAEHDFAGCKCGIMDQLASACAQSGTALIMDFKSLAIKPVELPRDLTVLLVLSGISRGLVDGEYNKRREECALATEKMGLKSIRDLPCDKYDELVQLLDLNLLRRTRHVHTENTRVHQLSVAFNNFDIDEISAIMRASHASLSKDFEVSTPKMDELVLKCDQLLVGQGGARMTGGGFGGAVVVLVKNSFADQFIASIKEQYKTPMGSPPEVLKVNPSARANII